MAAQGNWVSQIEPTNPLFVHLFDNPSQSLVSVIFNGDNFDNWRSSVIIALFERHKLAFVDGSCSLSVIHPLAEKQCHDVILVAQFFE